MKHKLDLLDNAISSLREALNKYDDGSNENLSAYKFSVLHFSHFFELLFKHYVTISHPLLIYKNPFSKKIEKENTIGLWEAVQFLKNEGTPITAEFNTDLEWIKKLRNEIEHFKFELDAIEVRNVLGRLIRATDEFNNTNDLVYIPSLLGGSHLATYIELGDEYKAKLATARLTAKAETQNNEVYLCHFCDEMDVAVQIGAERHCKFCEEVEELHECFHCHEEYTQDEVIVWNDDHPPHVEYICEYCYDHIMNMD